MPRRLRGRLGRRFVPRLARLEDRTLLASATWVGVSNQDYVGPDPGVGPDNILDDEFDLSGLKTTALVQKLVITDTPAGATRPEATWFYDNTTDADNSQSTSIPYSSTNIYGYLNAAISQPSESSPAKVYIDPYFLNYSVVNQAQTASPTSIATGDALVISITYADQTTDSSSVTVGATSIQPVPASTTSTALTGATGPVSYNSASVTGWSQNAGTAPSNPGWVQVPVSGLGGQVTGVQLSDPSGYLWGWGTLKTGAAYFTDQNIAYTSSSSTAGTVAFKPERNESGSTLTLRIVTSGPASTAVVQFTGGTSDPGLTATDIASGSITLAPSNDMSDGTNGDSANLLKDLNAKDASGHPLYGTINLQAGNYYFLNYITIARPVTITGVSMSQTTLNFASNSTSPWEGAILVQASHVTLSNLAIQFDANRPVYWITDKTDPVEEGDPSVIVAKAQNGGNILTNISFNSLAITGPMYYTGSGSYKQSQYTPAFDEYYASPDGSFKSVLYRDLHLFDALQVINGQITNCVLIGGTTAIGTGPWRIVNNDFRGALAGTVNATAITDYGDRDLDLESNHIHQVDSHGRMYAFLQYSGASATSYNSYIYNNAVYGNVGTIAGDNTYQNGTLGTEPDDFPQVILTENYRVDFEGKPLYVSGSAGSPQLNNPSATLASTNPADLTNGRILVIPQPEGNEVNIGDVVAVLSGRDPSHAGDSGAPGGDPTGTWTRVDQILSPANSSVLVLLVDQPLPLDPSPQYGYSISIYPSFVSSRYVQNNIDISNSFSTALSLTAQTGVQVTTNTITGGDLERRNGSGYLIQGASIVLQSYSYNDEDKPGIYAPKGYTFNPSIGASISGNTIINSTAGIVVQVTNFNSTNSPERRTYLTASITGNTFEWSSDFLARNNSVETDHSESSYPVPQLTSYATSTPSSASSPNPGYNPITKAIVIGITYDYILKSNNSGTGGDQDFYSNLPYHLSPWYVGSPNGFIDPKEVVATVQSNTYTILSAANSGPAITPLSVIIAGIVNGTTYASLTAFDQSLVVPGSPTGSKNFQFASQGTAVAPGYIAVSNNTYYSSAQGYGYTAFPNNDQNATPGSVYASDQTFQVDLPNGYYDVTPTLGDPGSSASEGGIQVVLQGGNTVDVESYTTGGTVSPTYLALVTGGNLTLRLIEPPGPNGEKPTAIRLHALTIVPRSSALAFQFGPAGTIPQAGYDLATNFTYYSTALSYGWSATPNYDQNTSMGPPTSVFASDQTFELSLPNGTYTLTPTLVGAPSTSDSVTVYVQGAQADVLQTGNGAATGSYVATVTSGTLTLRLLTSGINNYKAGIATLSVVPTGGSAGPIPAVGDAGFEQLAVGSGGYSNDSTGSAWTFSSPSGGSTAGYAGVSGNNSPYTGGNPSAPQGSQVALLQGGGMISQSVAGWAAGTYTISFDAAQRANYQASREDFEVLVDGAVVGTFTPSGTSYQVYTTVAFNVAAGSHTIEFLGLDSAGGDNTAFLDAVSVAVAAPVASAVGDAGFEQIAVGSGNYSNDPTGSAWTFSSPSGGSTAGYAGVSGNNSPYTGGNPSAPQGSQVALLQGGGMISQSVAGWAAGTYTISFDAAQRANYQASREDFEVLVDGAVVGQSFTPSGTSYQVYTTVAFNVAAGSHTIEFLGLDSAGGDNTAFLDAVSVAVAPTKPPGSP